MYINSFMNFDSFVNGFTFMSNNELAAFLSANAYSFTLEQFIYIRDYFKNEKKMFPTYNQLMLFDAINRARIIQKKGYSIYSASSNDGAEYILDTSKDMLAKRTTIRKGFNGAMPISYASEIASEYLNTIDCAEKAEDFIPASSNFTAGYYIHTDESEPIFVYADQAIYANDLAAQAQSQMGYSNMHNTLLMLVPTENIGPDEYNARVKELLSLPEVNSLISNHSVITAPYGILDVLLKETNGIFVNLSNIPEVEKNEYGRVVHLTSLISSCIGRHVFATNNMSIGIINHIAENYKLAAYVFAIRNSTKLCTLEAMKNPPFSFDFNILQTITNFKDHSPYTFTDEKAQPLGARKSAYLTDNRNGAKQTYRAERILNFGKAIACASARELDPSPYKTAALNIVDVICSLIAKGVAKNSITLSIQYSLLCGTDDPVELGKNLSAILGAYRSMIELCVSDKSPQISYNEKARSILSIASSKPPKRPIRSSFSSEHTHIYFYSLEFCENGLPDYEKLRKFISYYYSEIENDNILSAFAINENISAILHGASQNANIEFDSSFFAEQFNLAHGILFETRDLITVSNDIYCVGNTFKKE